MKNGVFWDVTPCGSCKKTDVLEEPSASFIRVTRIGELGTTLAATGNRHTTSQKTPFFIVTTVKTSNPIYTQPLHYTFILCMHAQNI
jgi:hypothetical protein